jgi:hypothetical protein
VKLVYLIPSETTFTGGLIAYDAGLPREMVPNHDTVPGGGRKVDIESLVQLQTTESFETIVG